MFRIVLLYACVTACCSHAVLPLAHHVPAVHAAAVVPVGGLYSQGYAGHGHLGYVSNGHLSHGLGYLNDGYIDHGYLSHGYGAKPLVHHLLKRSPHLVHPVGHIGHVAPIVVAPAAVSHQSRIDVRTATPVIAPIVAPPVLHAAPLLHKPLIAPLHYGVGHYGAAYPHLGHYY